MKKIRIIPRLDVKNDTVVKGINLEGLRVVGTPHEMAVKYYNDGADELLYMDAVASLYDRNSLSDIVAKTAQQVFIPITVGGGLRNLDDIYQALRSGADKVALNTAAIRIPELITEAANRYGSQCIVVSIEAKKQGEHTWEAYVETGRESTGIDVLEWAKRAVELGAGELLVTSVDCEGTQKGLDLELMQKISSSVSVPVIACGGIGTVPHACDGIQKTSAEAIACASIFHYNKMTITELKSQLSQHNISVRI